MTIEPAHLGGIALFLLFLGAAVLFQAEITRTETAGKAQREEVREVIERRMKEDPSARERLAERYQEIHSQAGRGVLHFAACMMLFVSFCFFWVYFYFRRRGGYRPVSLGDEVAALESPKCERDLR